MRWAENKEPGWCDKHIEAYVNIAGPVLGVPKAVSACLSGINALYSQNTQMANSIAFMVSCQVEAWLALH